jgi:hypothetical protein
VASSIRHVAPPDLPPLHLPIFPLHLLEPRILPPLAYINPATPRTHEVGRGRQPSPPRNPKTHQLVYSSVLSTNGAVTSSGQDLEHLEMVVNPPTASLKANTERIFANISYAVNFIIRIRIRRIRICISKFVFGFGKYCERFLCSFSPNTRGIRIQIYSTNILLSLGGRQMASSCFSEGWLEAI